MQLDAVSRVGSEQANEMVVANASVAVTPTGRIVVGALATGGEVSVFSPNGRFERRIGRTGQGPGESNYVTSIVAGRGDTIHVVDGMTRRLNRITASGQFIDITRLPSVVRDVVPLGGGRFFVAASVRTRNGVGIPLHVIDTAGTVRPLSEEISLVEPDQGQLRLIRHLSEGANGAIWAAHWQSYRIDSWTAAGKRIRTLTRQTSWFPVPGEYKSVFAQTTLPPPQIRGIYDDGNGYLWVYLLVPDAQWKPGRMLRKAGAHEGDLQPESWALDPFFDTVIEVIDLRRNVVIASTRDSRALIPAGHGYLSSYEEDGNGYPTYRIWRPRLVGVSPSME